jgi:enamine deaminase RidA (YjgF/YER057c/UK114 family)
VRNKLQYLNPKGTAPAQGLYSHVTRVEPGTLYFVAGQLSVDADGGVAGDGDFAAQFHQVFANLGNVLTGIGCDFSDVVKFTTYLAHSQDLQQFMALRKRVFPTLCGAEPYPPNTLLIVDRLVKEEFLIEVEAIVRGRD